jgi:hypothetical protein
LGLSDPDWMKSIRARVFSANISRFHEVQFIYFCDYLASRFELFNHIKADIFSNSNEEGEKKLLEKLKSLIKIDIELAKLINLLREYFKWMLLLIITLDVINITINVF